MKIRYAKTLNIREICYMQMLVTFCYCSHKLQNFIESFECLSQAIPGSFVYIE